MGIIEQELSVFVVFLKFSNQRSRANEFMAGHSAWLERGFDEGIFILAGSIKPGIGGAIIAHKISEADLQQRLNQDPFVQHGVVECEIAEISPSKTDPRLSFLL